MATESSLNIPQTQKAWRVVRRGPPSQALHFAQDAPVPSDLAEGEVLVKVEAAALNPVGYKLMKLLPNFVAKRPFDAAEHDLAGTVVASRSPRHAPGDRVFGFVETGLQRKTGQGALAQYARLPGSYLVKTPPGISSVEASGITLTAETAWQGLVDVGGIEEGQTVFIYGASSSVGLFAVQIAKAKGCKVWASASGKNEKLVRELGAHEFIDYTQKPIHQVLTDNPPSPKFHLILDCVGPMDPLLFAHSAAYLAPNGIYASTGPQPSGVVSFLNIAWELYLRPAWLGGTQRKLKVFFLKHKQEDLEALQRLMSEGKLKPVVDSVFDFEDALKAYDQIMTSRAKGKVVIKVDPSAN